MVLKYTVAVTAAVMVGVALAAATPVRAADYQPGEFLNFDLSKAALSPRPLGPVSRFEPVPVEAKTERSAAMAKPDMGGDPRPVATTRIRGAKPRVAVREAAVRDVAVRHVPVRVVRSQERPRGAGRVRLAHRRGNPLDAQAMDTRIQAWPCRPGNGGICNWR